MNEIFLTADGSHSVNSEKFGTSFHSIFGAISESKHVFLKAGLEQFNNTSISILEIGFGTGLNALLTALESSKKGQKIYYEAYEAFPLSNEEIIKLNYAELIENAGPTFQKIHHSEWGNPVLINPSFQLLKKLEKFETIEAIDAFDLIYFDAFAPNTQPELWTVQMMQKMYDSLKKGGTLVTYCAKGAVKRALKTAGFRVEGIPGPPRKREMTRAWKD